MRDVTSRIGKIEREASYLAKVEENASGTHVATSWHQEDGLRQDAECNGTMHHGAGFCNSASHASEAPDAYLLVADVCNLSNTDIPLPGFPVVIVYMAEVDRLLPLSSEFLPVNAVLCALVLWLVSCDL